jgi:hypothetical protein
MMWNLSTSPWCWVRRSDVPSAAFPAGTVAALAGRCAGTATLTRFENAVDGIIAVHRKEQHPMIETIAHAAVYRRDVGTMQSLSMFTLLTVGVLPSIEGSGHAGQMTHSVAVAPRQVPQGGPDGSRRTG